MITAGVGGQTRAPVTVATRGWTVHSSTVRTLMTVVNMAHVLVLTAAIVMKAGWGQSVVNSPVMECLTVVIEGGVLDQIGTLDNFEYILTKPIIAILYRS